MLSFAGAAALRKLGIPQTLGFMVAGIVLGLFGVASQEVVHSLRMIVSLALGLIGYNIGHELRSEDLGGRINKLLVIVIFEATAAFWVVSVLTYLILGQWHVSLLLGALASATAPAATVAVVRECRARGPFVDHLYGVVALDDAGCIILFGAIFSFASAALGGAQISFLENMLHAGQEIIFSLLAGIVAGFLIHLITRKIERKNELLIISLGIVLLLTAVATTLHLSPLLASMTAGMVLTNVSRKTIRILKIYIKQLWTQQVKMI